MIVSPRPRLALLFLIPTLFLSGETESSAQGFGSLYRFNYQRKAEIRHLHRPRIKIVRGADGSRQVTAGRPITFEFYAKRGWVSKIEVRSGLKVIRTIPVGKVTSGRGTVTLTAADLKGSKNFKFWAWQGLPGRQSLHGESVKYRLVN